MSRDLLDRRAEQPEGPEALRVYADHLLDAGDPTGELSVVALQRQVADSPELETARARARRG